MEQIDQAINFDIAVRSLLKAIILTGLRARSARLGEWNELFWKEIKNDADWNKKEGWLPVDWDDLESGRGRAIIWVIPKERMKGKKGKKASHRVPVSTTLLDILLQMRDVIEKEGRDPKFIFSNNIRRSDSKPGPLSHKRLRTLYRKLDLPSDVEGRYAVVHGFRATIRDWCAEKHVPFELAESVLAHTLPTVVRAYLRSDVISDRARLMQAWSDHATGTLPDDWKWNDLDNETLRLITALRQRAEQAEKSLLSTRSALSGWRPGLSRWIKNSILCSRRRPERPAATHTRPRRIPSPAQAHRRLAPGHSAKQDSGRASALRHPGIPGEVL